VHLRLQKKANGDDAASNPGAMGSTDDATQPPAKVLWSPLSLSSDHGDSCAPA
jgi:hypothetical protein